MIRHFKIWVSILGVCLAALVIVFAGSLFIGSCSYRNNCLDGGRAEFTHTPIATLIPAALRVNTAPYQYSSSSDICTVSAGTLLSAWVSSGFPETQPFFFTDKNNIACEATFADVQPLFSESNLWVQGAMACTSCHNADLSAAASAQLDLSSFVGVVAGSHRPPGSTTGVDILGAGNWQKSRLNLVLFVNRQMPYGFRPDSVPAEGPIIPAGIPVSVANATPEPPSGDEIARPSNPGDAGDAINLSGDRVVGKQIFIDRCQMCHGTEGKGEIPNPGTGDESVPPVNPIDSTLISPDYKTYAFNLDLFIQNGSTPGGPNPSLFMPPWGAQNGLTQQQIADVISYVIDLNK